MKASSSTDNNQRTWDSWFQGSGRKGKLIRTIIHAPNIPWIYDTATERRRRKDASSITHGDGAWNTYRRTKGWTGYQPVVKVQKRMTLEILTMMLLGEHIRMYAYFLESIISRIIIRWKMNISSVMLRQNGMERRIIHYLGPHDALTPEILLSRLGGWFGTPGFTQAWADQWRGYSITSHGLTR